VVAPGLQAADIVWPVANLARTKDGRMGSKRFVWTLTPSGIDDHYRPDYEVYLDDGSRMRLGELPSGTRFRFMEQGPVFEVLAQLPPGPSDSSSALLP
jgi:hypothetical protein